MDTPTEHLMKSILENDQNIIILNNDIHVNKICKNGMTLIGAAAKTGNLPLLRLLIDFHNNKETFLNSNENRSKPQHLQLDVDSTARYKNIWYFVITRDEDNEFGDGPTPEGMEGLEWDLEVNDSNNFNTASDSSNSINDSTEDLYKWYASILNRTAVLLDSPEKDFSRLDKHQGQSVLHYAVNSGSVEMVQYLLETFGRDLDVNQNDINGYNCLHKAVAKRDVNMVDFLLKNRADVDAMAGRHRQTSLHIAAKMGHHSVLLQLINSDCEVNALDAKDRSALNWALRQNDETAVQILCEAGCSVNSEEYDDVSLLDLAVYSGSASSVQSLLRHGARITPSHYLLHKAITQNNLDVVMTLIDWGATINCRDSNGYTPIMTACSRKNPLILKYLIYKGGNVNIPSHIDGKTALHVCSQDVRSESTVEQLISILVNSGANMNATSYQGTVLLHSIVLENHYAAMTLIRHGANVNIRDEKMCWDVLSVSLRYGTLDLCKTTVYAGFKLNYMSHDPRRLRKGPNDEIYDFIAHVKTNPLNLKDLCRIVIRNNIGSVQLLTKIRTLPLPTILHKYLSLEILD